MGVTYKDGQPVGVIKLEEVRKELIKMREGTKYTKTISIMALLVSIASFLFNFII